MKSIKIVVLGDHVTKKGRLLATYKMRKPPDRYVPILFDDNMDTTYEDKPVRLNLSGVEGEKSTLSTRSALYLATDVFIVLFSLIDPSSLQNVELKWVPDIIKSCPGVPYILIGTKKEKRDHFADNIDKYKSKGRKPISTEEGIRMKEKTQALEYFECEKDNLSDIDHIFDLAMKCVFECQNKPFVSTFVPKSEKEKGSSAIIGFFGDGNSGKKEIASKFILGEFFDLVNLPEDDFFKVVEIHNEIKKIKIELDFPYNFLNMIGLVLVFNANQPKSLRSLQSIVNSHDESIDEIPTVLVAYYEDSKRQEDEAFSKRAAKFEGEFKCKYFEVVSNSNSNDTVEEIFNHLFAMVPKESVKDEGKKRRRKKSKRKVDKK